MTDTTVNVRYMVDDVEAAVAFYTTHLGFTLLSNAAPAFADVTRADLRLLLSGPTSSAGRPMPDGRRPEAGGWNRIHLVVDDLLIEVERLRAAGLRFRNDIVTGPGGSQILLEDPAGNPVELFQPATPPNLDEYPETDPRHQTRKVRYQFEELVDHLRHDMAGFDDPGARALFDTAAAVLAGLAKAFADFEGP
jgi:catechol 2,3-dioxygenase-like lactoylglutathione lyase family enzyme